MNELELQRVIRGEPQSVRSFIQDFGPVFRAVVRRRVSGHWRQQEDDLLQEIFSGLFAQNARVLRTWDAQKGRSLKNFLQVFAEQRTLDWLRRKHRESREELTEEAALMRKADAGQDLHKREPPEWLEPLLSQFRTECNPEDQRIVELSYIEDLSVREIAAILKLSEDAIYQRRHRLKTRLLKIKQELSEKLGLKT